MTIPMVFKVECISCLIAAIAATHGVYNNVNTRKLTAERTVNKVPRAADTWAAFVPNKTLRVETTASFAVIPVTRAVEILQSAKPSGLKIGASKCPSMASRLFALSVTTFNRLSNVCKNQMIIDARKIIVNALSKKSLAFSHINSRTLLKDGKR